MAENCQHLKVFALAPDVITSEQISSLKQAEVCNSEEGLLAMHPTSVSCVEPARHARARSSQYNVLQRAEQQTQMLVSVYIAAGGTLSCVVADESWGEQLFPAHASNLLTKLTARSFLHQAIQLTATKDGYRDFDRSES